MKIIMLTSEFLPVLGGIGAYARDLANAGINLGHEVTLIAPNYYKNNTQLDASLPYKIIRFNGGKHTMRDLINKTALILKLKNTLQEADVIHAVDWPFYIPLAILNKLHPNKAKKIITYHGTEINYMKSPARKTILSMVSFWSGWATFITNSQYTKNLLSSTFPIASESTIKAIPLGVNSPKQLFKKDYARKQLGISNDDFIILTVGRLVRRKGHLILANSLKKLQQPYTEKLQWVICGPDGDKEYMEELDCALKELTVRTNRVGAVSEEGLALYYAAADLFCLTSEANSAGQVEGFGLVFLEAASYGVPALSTKVGGIPDAIIDKKTGILVSPEDLTGITENLKKLMDDAQLLSQFGHAAREHANIETWENVFKKTYLSL